MIAILLAVPGIPSDGLQMPVARGANPHLIPCGRNDQRPDPVQDRSISDPGASGVHVAEPLARAFLADAWRLIGYVSKPDAGMKLLAHMITSGSLHSSFQLVPHPARQLSKCARE